MAKYLDLTGVTYLWSCIKTWVGNYTSLSNGTITIGNNSITPITSHQDISGKANSADLAAVATSGSYNDLSNKPTIPDDSSLVHKDSGNGIVETGLSVHEIDIYRAKIRDDNGIKSEVLGTLLINNDDGTGEILLEDENNDGFVQIKRKNGASTETLQQALNERNNVQADWNESSSSSAAYINNKPNVQTVSITKNTAQETVGVTIDGSSTILIQGTEPSGSSQGDTAPTWGALNSKISGILNTKGTASGICPLNANSKVDSQYLPSYVDDVIEAYARSGQTALSSTWLATENASGTVITPESGKIYVLIADSGNYAANTQFRWGGSAYVKLADGGVSAITTAEIDAIVAN